MPAIDPFSGMTPEMIQQIFGLAPLGEQQNQLGQQLQEALDERNQPEQHHTTGIGAGLGALGSVYRTVDSRRKEAALRPQQMAVSQQMADRRQALAEAYIAALRGGQPQQPQGQDGSYGGIPGMADEAD